MKLPNSLRLRNKEVNIRENGGYTQQFRKSVTVASLSSKHERVELDPGLWYQRSHLVAAHFWSRRLSLLQRGLPLLIFGILS